MKSISIGICLLASCLCAQDEAVTLTLTSLGQGIEASTKISDSIGIRGLVAGTLWSGTYWSDVCDDDDYRMEYEAKTHTLSGGMLLDYFITDSWRITTGAIYNGYDMTLHGKSTNGLYNINDKLYYASKVGSLDGYIRYEKVMPYLGFGYILPFHDKSWSIGFDAGVLYGKPKTQLTATGAVNNPALAIDVQQELKKIEDESIFGTNFYPYLSIGFNYYF